MKRIAGITAVIVLLFLGASASGSDALSAKRESIKLTGELLVSELQKKAKAILLDENALGAEVNNNKRLHSDPKKSREVLQAIAENSIQHWYQQEVQQVINQLNARRPENVSDWFSPEERQKLLTCPDNIIKQNISRNFDSLFTGVRKRVCDEQWNRVALDVYPTEEEFEKSGRSRLKSILLERLLQSQKELLFDENKALLTTDFIEPILNDVEGQQKEQRQIVERSTGGRGVVPDDIQTFIGGEIDAYQKKLEKEKAGKKIAAKVYGIFPSVKKIIPEQARTLAVKRFSDALSEMKFPVGKDKVKSLITSELREHVDRDKSWKQCFDTFKNDIIGEALTKYTANAPKGKRTEFRQFLENLIAGNDSSKKVAIEMAAKSLSEDFLNVRTELGEEQFREFFGPLVSGSWQPSDEEIDSHYHKPEPTISEPLRMPGIFSKPVGSREILDETGEKVLTTEKEILKEGVSAVRNQMEIVDNVELEFEREITEKEKIAELPTEEELIKNYTAKVKRNWSRKELSGKYKTLFARASEDIKKRVRAMLRERKETIKETERRQVELADMAERIRKTPPPKTPQEKMAAGGVSEDKAAGAGDKGPGGKGEGRKSEMIFAPDMVIDLDCDDKEVEVIIAFPKKKALTRRFVMDVDNSADPDKMPFKNEIQMVFKAWLSQSVEGDKDVHLFVVTRILDGRLRYGVLFSIRQCLEGALSSVSNEHLKVHWFDGLFGKKEKGIYDIFETLTRWFQFF